MSQIKKIKALYYIRITDDNVPLVLLIRFILEARAEIKFAFWEI